MHWPKKKERNEKRPTLLTETEENQRLNSRKPTNRGRPQNWKTAVIKVENRKIKPNQTLAKSAKPKFLTPPSLLRPVYTGDFCRGNSMQLLSRWSCYKFQTCSKPLRYCGYKSHWKSHLVYTCDFEVALSCSDKNRLCKRAERWDRENCHEW